MVCLFTSEAMNDRIWTRHLSQSLSMLVCCGPALSIKMTFSEIMWFEHFLFHQILTIFQHFHHHWVKISLQVCIIRYIPTCKLDFAQKWWQCYNFVKFWWKMKFFNHIISKNVTFILNTFKGLGNCKASKVKVQGTWRGPGSTPGWADHPEN